MNSFQQNLEKYAALAVEVGVNVQKDQTLVINAPIGSVDFVRLITKKAYEVGAKHVYVEWNDEELTRMKFDLAPDEAFNEFPTWKAKGMETLAENGAAFMSIVSQNPDLLKGVNPLRIQAAQKAGGQAMAKYRNYVQADKVSWCVIAAPNEAWAAKVFPDAPKEKQVDMLWEAIFSATRADLEDPVQAWQEHKANLDNKAEFLNKKKYKKLHYKAPGTDLTIELDPKHIWAGGRSANEVGTEFVANIPTEEVFTTPHKDGVNGVVSSTKPLNYGGNLIDKFSLTFKDGKVVDFTAETGYESLKSLLDTDEGAKRLGEVALVPHDSPISNANIIFFNTLFDENASNHVALGNAYSFCLEGGKTMSREELDKAGANESLTHVDFMIGSAEMDIDGETADGEVEPLFRNGNWAI
ncbi:aminopeptidase [Lottiidibacillus patelloidae]|uniref:Aminopeptidase n=1 Tax=Lottiidibacillus patelloidae TaxID=2670334 RepID=A0A263BSL5_9BACI|nr:aminopeptidase [Lottiidibacillus patelloidae]OZM56704.1 aminopeptidase [Lottiidibacillus patelloidae]